MPQNKKQKKKKQKFNIFSALTLTEKVFRKLPKRERQSLSFFFFLFLGLFFKWILKKK